MKVKMTRSTIADKKPRNLGDVVELSDKEATFLIKMGMAKPFAAEDKPSKADK